MDLFTIAILFGLAVAGIELDAYQHPRTLDVAVVDQGDTTGTGLDVGLVNGIVHHELDRMTRVPSMLSRPHISPSEEKGFVWALGDATGTTPFLNVIASAVQSTPDSLNVGVYSDSGKLKVYVFGSETAVPSRDGRFDLTITQEDGESSVDTVKRAAIAGAARIDPYVAMLYLLSGFERTGQERHAAAALRIAQVPMMRRAAQGSGLLLLARMQNVAGLVQLRRGNLDLASTAFENGLDHVPPGNIGPTPVILRLNKAFVDIARNDTDDAAAQLAQVISSTDNFQKLVGLKVSTTEDRPFTLTIDDVNFLRSTAETIAAGIALRHQQTDDATALLKKALQSYPRQIGATSMLADIAAMRGDLATAQSLRATVTEQAQDENPYLEVALVHSTLSFTTDAVTLKRSQYVAR